MRNYITLNGKNSNEINGLLIQELPPISKPQIRTEVEEIDGRDGDIVTKLGFAAYDKEFTVGLYKDFDINAIIAYFNSEGTVVFSNEPDKYYNYQIIDQIDFERLVRYRTATVRMHCQPFKYSNTEGARTLGNKGTASGEGSFITLDNTPEAQFSKIDPKGNATQTTYSGKNILPSNGLSTSTNNGITYTPTYNDNGELLYITANGTASNNSSYDIGYADFIADKKYTISGSIGGSDQTYRIWTQSSTAFPLGNRLWSTNGARTATASASEAHCRVYIQVLSGATVNNVKFYPQIEQSASESEYEPYTGGASPNPDYPQDIQVVTGQQVVKIHGKNLFSVSFRTGGQTPASDDNAFTLTKPDTRTARYDFPTPLPSGTYTLSTNIIRNTASGRGLNVNILKADNQSIITTYFNGTGVKALTFRVPEGVECYGIYCFISNDDADGSTVETIDTMLESDSTTSDYEPYQEQNYPISLGSKILVKIPNTEYEDKPVKVGDTWYIRRAVGKVAININGYNASYTNVDYAIFDKPSDMLNYDTYTQTQILCESAISPELSGGYDQASQIGRLCSGANKTHLWIGVAKGTTQATAKTLLDGKAIYYPLAAPVDEEITNETLISQLEALYNQAHAYKGRTHVAAIAQGSNAPHIIEAEVQRSSDGNITNNGNIVSKPTLTIYGSGNIGVSLNGYQIFEITLGDEEYITIDTAAMEAYKDTLDNLKNRLVNGDYSKFALRPGSNMIEFSGTVSKCVISKYSRWL